MVRRLAPILAIPFCLSGAATAAAATRDARIAGSSLRIETSCARRVEIRADPALHDEVAVRAAADHPEELDRLRAESGRVARLHPDAAGCWQPDGAFAPTLDLVLLVPSAFGLSIDDAGHPDYAVGPVGGALALRLSGAVRFRDADVTVLAATLGGDDAVTLDRVRGAAQIELSGRNGLDIGEADMPALALSVSGVGRAGIARGRIGSAQLDESGGGAIRIGATVGTATVAISGQGSIRLARVTGPLAREVSGTGTVTVGE